MFPINPVTTAPAEPEAPKIEIPAAEVGQHKLANYLMCSFQEDLRDNEDAFDLAIRLLRELRVRRDSSQPRLRD